METMTDTGAPEKACIIGAGSSGITALKTLEEHGIPCDCFEKGSGVLSAVIPEDPAPMMHAF